MRYLRVETDSSEFIFIISEYTYKYVYICFWRQVTSFINERIHSHSQGILKIVEPKNHSIEYEARFGIDVICWFS